MPVEDSPTLKLTTLRTLAMLSTKICWVFPTPKLTNACWKTSTSTMPLMNVSFRPQLLSTGLRKAPVIFYQSKTKANVVRVGLLLRPVPWKLWFRSRIPKQLDLSFPLFASEQELVDCTSNNVTNRKLFGTTYGCYGCSGCNASIAWSFSRRWGSSTNEYYPYTSGGTGRATTCKGLPPAGSVKAGA